MEAGEGGGECRLVIRLFCQHGMLSRSDDRSIGPPSAPVHSLTHSSFLNSNNVGVIKTHRLNYSPAALLYANANRNDCSSFWVASSKILKEWFVKPSPPRSRTFELTSGDATSGRNTSTSSLAIQEELPRFPSTTVLELVASKVSAPNPLEVQSVRPFPFLILNLPLNLVLPPS